MGHLACSNIAVATSLGLVGGFSRTYHLSNKGSNEKAEVILRVTCSHEKFVASYSNMALPIAFQIDQTHYIGNTGTSFVCIWGGADLFDYYVHIQLQLHTYT